jgi:hypothetical protein
MLLLGGAAGVGALGLLAAGVGVGVGVRVSPGGVTTLGGLFLSKLLSLDLLKAL